MLEIMKSDIAGRINLKYELAGDAWLALDEIQRIEQFPLRGDDFIRYSFFESYTHVYYVRPGLCGIKKVYCEDFQNDDFGAASDVPILDSSIAVLSALCKFVVSQSASEAAHV